MESLNSFEISIVPRVLLETGGCLSWGGLVPGRFQLERSSERYVEYVLLSGGERVFKKRITG